MRKNKVFVLSLCLALIMGLVSGCSGSAKKAFNENGSDVPTITGRVTAIDGNNITLSLYSGRGLENGGSRQGGDRPKGGRPNGDRPKGGRPGDGNTGDGNTEDGNTEGKETNFIPGTTDEEIPNVKPDVPSTETVPEDRNTREAEEKVITIADNTEIKIEDGDSTQNGSLSDITVGCNLTVTYTKDDSGNETINSVTVKNFSGGPGGQDWANKVQSMETSATDGE